jgi:hypothetical protein
VAADRCSLSSGGGKNFTHSAAHPRAHTLASMARRTAVNRDFSTKERKNPAGTGAAMPDGSCPIKTRRDLLPEQRCDTL